MTASSSCSKSLSQNPQITPARRRCHTGFGIGRKVASPRRSLALLAAAAIAVSAAGGCSKQNKRPTNSQPADTAAPTAGAPATRLAGTRPAPTLPVAPSAAATRPAATLPASTYEARPPYPVQLHVRSPRDPQPGWLKIIELQDLHQPATAAGKFPRQNRIYVDTVNVQKIRIHIGHLPIGEGKPIMLQIDEQVMEIRGKRNREFITMGRTQVGVWESVPD